MTIPRDFAEQERRRFWARKQQEHTMNNTISIPGFIHAQPASEFDSGPEVIHGHRMTFFTHKDMKECGYVMVTPVTISFELPHGWDPRAQQIEALRQQETKLRAEFQKRVTLIHAQINKLQALEMA